MSGEFCTACGAAMAVSVERGHRACSQCATLHYENPVVFAACIVESASGEVRLFRSRLAADESIQACAEGALGSFGEGVGVEPDALALYCALTDLDSGEVCFVFRLTEVVEGTLPVLEQPASIVWAVSLCSRYAADRTAGCMPVYTGSVAGGALDLVAVPPGDNGVSPDCV